MLFKKENMKKIRTEQRWTMRALSKKLKVSTTTLHMWESGHHEPPAKKIIEMAHLFGVKLDEFVNNEAAATGDSKTFKKKVLRVKLIDSLRGLEIDKSVGRLNAEVDFLEKKVRELSLLVRTILQITPVPFYIKDVNQEYILGNNALREILRLPDDFHFSGKKDKDIFSEIEARNNSKEDFSVIHEKTALRYKEEYIPGTRKKKWGEIHKFPVVDMDSSILGLMGVFIDITKRKNEEELRMKLEEMLDSLDETIWMARDLEEKEDGRMFVSECLYISKTAARKTILKVKIDLSYQEQLDYYRALIIEEPGRIKHNLSKIREGEVSEVKYSMKIPDIEETLKVKDRMFYKSDLDIFIGVITIDKAPFASVKLDYFKDS